MKACLGVIGVLAVLVGCGPANTCGISPFCPRVAHEPQPVGEVPGGPVVVRRGQTVTATVHITFPQGGGPQPVTLVFPAAPAPADPDVIAVPGGGVTVRRTQDPVPGDTTRITVTAAPDAALREEQAVSAGLRKVTTSEPDRLGGLVFSLTVR